MSKRRAVEIADRRWTVRWVTRLGKHEGDSRADKAGDCDRDARVIRVLHGLTQDEERRVLIHETLHAELWDLDEEAVDRISESIADVLRRCGHGPS